jgi:integrase/recombinase XerD
MYEKYLLQLEEAGKIRNLKERSIDCYKNYVSYFLNYMEKVPEELTFLSGNFAKKSPAIVTFH